MIIRLRGGAPRCGDAENEYRQGTTRVPPRYHWVIVRETFVPHGRLIIVFGDFSLLQNEMEKYICPKTVKIVESIDPGAYEVPFWTKSSHRTWPGAGRSNL